MQEAFTRPNVFISKCLGFAKCRWNGEVINDSFIENLKKFVNPITVCPECEIGLGVPRDPVRIVQNDSGFFMLQLNTGKDLTSKMTSFTESYLSLLKDMDGFVLKDRSPSCGIKEVKVYPGLQPQAAIRKSSGFFGKEVLRRFKYAAIESEARLSNLEIREHFLTRIFTTARFRQISFGFKINNLVQFHAQNKFLLMLYNQELLKRMGNIVANREKKPAEQVFLAYENSLKLALSKKPSFTAAINVLMHGLGYFKKFLTAEEKRFFLNSLEEYRRQQVVLSVPVGILHSYALRFKESYISQQSFLSPFPRQLLQIRDSAKKK